ncbi:MAG: CHAD domain-containing protein [Planctomycetota bacterium]
MRARPIPDLDGLASTRSQVGVVLGTRLDEMLELAPRALDPCAEEPLHDLRIAGKRLRYALESLAFCLPPWSAEIIDQLKEVQARLGDIHDLDVGMARIRRELRRALDGLRRRARYLADHEQVAAFSRELHDGEASGLVHLLDLLHERRALRHAEFVLFWHELAATGFAERVQTLWTRDDVDAT